MYNTKNKDMSNFKTTKTQQHTRENGNKHPLPKNLK